MICKITAFEINGGVYILSGSDYAVVDVKQDGAVICQASLTAENYNENGELVFEIPENVITANVPAVSIRLFRGSEEIEADKCNYCFPKESIAAVIDENSGNDIPAGAEAVSERAAVLGALSEELHAEFTARYAGTSARVLWEAEQKGNMMSGFTGNYIRISAPYDPQKVNTVVETTVPGQKF